MTAEPIGTDHPEDLEFERWLAAHPRVLPKFVELAVELLDAGQTRVGARQVYEQMRWLYLTRAWSDGFALNNNFLPLLARRATEVEPRLKPAIRLRRLRRDRPVLAPLRLLGERSARREAS